MNACDQTLVLWFSSSWDGSTNADRGSIDIRARPRARLVALAPGQATWHSGAGRHFRQRNVDCNVRA